MKIKMYLSLLLFFTTIINSGNFEVNKIEPPNWWSGMKWNEVQLMVYGKNIKDAEVSVEGENVKLIKVHNAESSSYLFLDLAIEEAGTVNINFTKAGNSVNYKYEILERESPTESHKGFSNNDVLYLIFPDRFADGDTTNNYLFNEKEEFSFRDLNGRHGGDIQGMIDNLDYLKELGVSTIWSTPVLENNMYMSYHGYAATDLYKVDPRQGTNELYKKFVEEAHKKGLKIIYDHVTNHVGVNHPWTSDLPFSDWYNGSVENHHTTRHNKIAYLDIHGDNESVEFTTNGWFTSYMPDLNQRNPFLAKYIIQNTIWWIEYAGIDGIREDTYPYNYQPFMSEWAKVLLDEYPDLNIVGEIWTGVPSFLAKYQGNSFFPTAINSHLPALTDFALRDAFVRYLEGSRGIYDIYETIAQDFLYANPNNLVTFIDNHDIDRGLYAADTNYAKFKIALQILLTTRGIPKLFYGSEIGLAGGGHHGRIREAFPGGFPFSNQNAFEEIGRDSVQNDLFNFTKKLIELRNSNSALKTGKLIQFPPYDDVYIYFREDDDNTFMIIINDNEETKEIDLSFVAHKLKSFNKADAVLGKHNLTLGEKPSLKMNKLSGEMFLLK